MNSFIQKINDKALDLGATSIGYSYLENVLPNQLRHLEYGISVLVRLSDEIINQIETAPTFTYFHHYRDINTLIDQICLRISLLIQNEGYLAMNIPASQTVTDASREKYRAVFPHKTAAVLAGMGWIGKNGLFITKEYGPRIRLGTILTNMPVPTNETVHESLCGDCISCVNACPVGALKGSNWVMGMEREEIVDAHLCNEHMKTAYKDIGRGSVCGLCVKACPQGSKTLR